MSINKIEKIGPKQRGPFASGKHFPERPPSCGSLKGCIIAGMGIPFENRKFSIESIKSYKSLKSRELLPSKNSKGRESSLRSENMSLQDAADSMNSVGSNQNNANFIKNQYISQILTVSEKRDRSESAANVLSPNGQLSKPSGIP